jgi:HD-like signal output (HDOD) protein
MSILPANSAQEIPAAHAWLTHIERLPVLPAAYRELQTALNDEANGLSEVARIVARDPGMTGELLQLANSAAFAPQERVGSVDAALGVVGLGVLRGLVLAQGLFRDIQTPARGPFSRDYIWRHSFSTGMLARTLVKRLGRGSGVDAETAFTAGLLHDLGKLLLGLAYAERYFQLLIVSVNERKALVQVEQEAFGVSHAEAAAYLFSTWHLPEPLISAVRFHHSPSALDPEHFTAATAVHIASVLEYEHSGPPPFRATALEEGHLAAVGLPVTAAGIRALLNPG